MAKIIIISVITA